MLPAVLDQIHHVYHVQTDPIQSGHLGIYMERNAQDNVIPCVNCLQNRDSCETLRLRGSLQPMVTPAGPDTCVALCSMSKQHLDSLESNWKDLHRVMSSHVLIVCKTGTVVTLSDSGGVCSP
jgi:hypothetical protein